MANSVKMKGKTVDEAIDMALQVLGKKKEEVSVKVLNEAEGAVLGMFGGKEAEVEVSIRVGMGDEAKNLLQEILDNMKFLTLVSIKSDTAENLELDIKGEDMGRIIGRGGATIDALQYLVGTILSKRHEQRVRVTVDAEGYREKRKAIVIEDTDKIAKEVEKAGSEKVLPPMPASERRLIHMHIQENYPNLMSFSKGEGAGRQLVIAPKSDKA